MSDIPVKCSRIPNAASLQAEEPRVITCAGCDLVKPESTVYEYHCQPCAESLVGLYVDKRIPIGPTDV